MQVTVWIMIWIGVARILGASRELLAGAGAAALPSLSLGGLAGGLRAAFDGFTPAVWGVILLKALNGLLIPATFKCAPSPRRRRPAADPSPAAPAPLPSPRLASCSALPPSRAPPLAPRPLMRTA